MTADLPGARPAEQRRPGLVPDTLAGFLRDRLDELEQEVRLASLGRGEPHTVDCGVRLGYWAEHACTCGWPARVLAEVEAKRRLLAGIDLDSAHEPIDMASEHTLRLLALPYAGHPAYRQEWAP